MSARVVGHWLLGLLLLTLFLGCDGDTGNQGPPGVSTGTLSGQVETASGSPLAGATVTTEPPSASATTDSAGRFVIESVPIGVYEVRASAAGYGDGFARDVSVISGGTADVRIELTSTAASVKGVVQDAADLRVPDAAVVLIEAEEVAASVSEEPLAALESSSDQRAITDADGEFELVDVREGSYYVYVVPGDDIRLPGGSRSRVATRIEPGANDLGTIELSQQPRPTARYVGSTSCLTGCHEGGVAPDKHQYIQTLHAMTYRVPGEYTLNQDPSLYPRRDRALGYFFDGNSEDNTGDGDEVGYRLTSISQAYDVLIGHDGRLFASFSTKDGLIVSERYYVDFTFGGEGLYKQRFVTRIADSHYATPGTGSYYILPIQFDEQIQEGLGVDPWVAYNAANWPTGPTVPGGPAGTPARGKSFDLNCAGCHFTGTSLSVDASGDYRADAVDDPNGVLDYDGDGSRDEITQGCEVCHGPGSDHIDAPGRRIIQPALLSAERAAMVCGQCHVRGEGKGTSAGLHTEYPSKGADAAIGFPRAGISRAEFAASYHTDKPGQWADDGRSAKQHHQQYHDHIRSKHYKNASYLLACDSCHVSHDATNSHQVIGKLEDNSACLGCHASESPFSLPPDPSGQAIAVSVEAHMADYADMTAPYDPGNALGLVDLSLLGYLETPFLGGSGNCVSCHMPKTAKSAAQWIKSGGRSGTILLGDITSHQFRIINPSVSSALKLAGEADVIPNSCGTCHNELTGVRPDLVP